MDESLYSGMVRINTSSIAGDNNDLNIMTYYPLTHSQRNYLLDYIERYNVSPDRVFIDDWSEDKSFGTIIQSIKRQLGLQFF